MRLCRWCGKIGALRQGKGASTKWYFHPPCWQAVDVFFGWDMEVPGATATR